MIKRKLQVFVSSTFTDLIEERQAAVSAILKAGHIPAGMELFTAGDRSQKETIERWITESDVYMLILGGRYGSLENASSLSYTELEYDFAVSKGIPLFAVVMREDALEQKVKSLGTAYLEKDNPHLLKAFREKVLSRISAFFSDAKDIRLCVYESLLDHANNAELKGWVSGIDLEDIKPIKAENQRLIDENTGLKKRLDALSKKRPNSTELDSDEAHDLIQLIKEIRIRLPQHLSKEGRSDESLLMLIYQYSEDMIGGITNSYGMSDTHNFLFYSVLPRLQPHGLADSEKVAGKAYRRYFLSQKGQALVAELDRRLVKVRKKESEHESTERADEQKLPSATPRRRSKKASSLA